MKVLPIIELWFVFFILFQTARFIRGTDDFPEFILSFLVEEVPPQYIQNIWIERTFYLIQLLIICLTVRAYYKKKKNIRKKLTNEEEESRISAWEPEELVTGDVGMPAEKERVVQSRFGKYLTINDKKCLNLASLSFLGLGENLDIETSIVKSIRKYGVGSCGPRGFYGTVDVHLELEELIARFMCMEEAIIYSYGFSTISSAIQAYSRRGDVIFADEEVNYAIQKGMQATRSDIRYFKHNDMDDLEKLLIEQGKRDLKNEQKASKTRRFLIVEGIYMKTGQICNLPQLIHLRKKYKLRIFVDESISFGTLGKYGKGVTDYFNIPIIEVDMIMATMECALSSVGGFCVGSRFIVEHQRLSGLGYCFSASLPPPLATAAISAIQIIQDKPEIVAQLQEVCTSFHEELTKSNILTEYFTISGHPLSPIKYLQKADSRILDKIVQICEQNNLAVTIPAYLDSEEKTPVQSIRLSINRLLTSSEIKCAVLVIEVALKQALNEEEQNNP